MLHPHEGPPTTSGYVPLAFDDERVAYAPRAFAVLRRFCQLTALELPRLATTSPPNKEN